MDAVLQILIITALLSIVMNTLLKKYDFPPIIGYIIAGALVTYLFSLRETSIHILYEVSEFGIAFLMFTIGLEFSVNHFKKLKKEVFLFGALQVIITAFLFALAAHVLFEMALKTSIIIGCALALSSTAIVLKILNENRDIGKAYGRSVLGILLFQDLAVIPMLLMLSFFTATGIAIETLIVNTALSAALVLAVLYLSGKYLVTPFLSFVFDSHSLELFIGAVLLIAITTSYIAYLFGFSYSLGAFIGGMLLAETPFKHQIEADLTPFRDLLLGVFFVTVGMQISFHFMVEHFTAILAIMATVMLFKALILFGILRFFATSAHALKSAIALSQVGEFSFVVLELARIGGITTKEINQTMVIAVVFSMILTPFIVRHLHAIIQTLLRSKTSAQETISSAGIKDHIVILGYGSLGQQICKTLKTLGLLYIAIDNKRTLAEASAHNGDPFILGNAHLQHILVHAHPKDSLAIIIAVEDDEECVALVESVFRTAPNAHIVVSGRNEHSSLLHDKRVRSFIHEHKEVARSIVTRAISCQLSQEDAHDV